MAKQISITLVVRRGLEKAAASNPGFMCCLSSSGELQLNATIITTTRSREPLLSQKGPGVTS